MGAPVVACGDAPPVFELGEQVLDLVALAVERRVVCVGGFAASAGRDARLDAPGFQFRTEPCAVIAVIRTRPSDGWRRS